MGTDRLKLWVPRALAVLLALGAFALIRSPVEAEVNRVPGVHPVPQNIDGLLDGKQPGDLVRQQGGNEQWRVQCGSVIGMLFEPIAGSANWEIRGEAVHSVGPCMKAAFNKFLLAEFLLLVGAGVLLAAKLRSGRG